MTNPKKRLNSRPSEQANFEEMDHRLACGWHVEVEGSGQRKRYLKQAKLMTQQMESNQASSSKSAVL